ncbi:hypothetical protein ACH3XW_49385 [Acanthocheilonema viteae]
MEYNMCGRSENEYRTILHYRLLRIVLHLENGIKGIEEAFEVCFQKALDQLFETVNYSTMKRNRLVSA